MARQNLKQPLENTQIHTPFTLWTNFLYVKIIYNTVLKKVYTILHCQNCVYLCVYDLFQIPLSL
jgi:hypothetical protein